MSSDNSAALRQELNTLELGKNWYWYLIAGIIMFIGGLLALAKPFSASITVELIAGWTFIFSGLVNVIQTFSAKGVGAKTWVLALGVLGIMLGTSLLTHPLAGLMSLTIVVGILIILSGVAKLLYGFKIRRSKGWILLVFSGIVSIVLAIFILGNIQTSSLITLGVLLAVELISSGISFIVVSFLLKKLK